MARKRGLRSNTSVTAATSSDEDSISAFQFQIVQRPTPAKNPLATALANQEGDGSGGDEIESSDEIGENGVVIKRQPLPKRGRAAGEPPKKDADSPESSLLKRKAAKSPLPKKKKGKAAAQAAQVARPPLPEKAAARTEFSRKPPLTGPEDETANVEPSPEAADPAGPQAGEYNAEKHFKEKSQMYRYLWQLVLTLEQAHSTSFKGAFLKIDDAKASILNTKLRKLFVQEIQHEMWWNDMDREVMKVLRDLIK